MNDPFSSMRAALDGYKVEQPKACRVNSKTGEKRVSVCGGRFKVSVWKDGRHVHVGRFKTIEDAVSERDLFLQNGGRSL